MVFLNSKRILNQWWNQFPSQLHRITICRFLASIGAGGVIYFTALVFNDISLTGTQIGIGFCAAAIAGTITRLAVGINLDRGLGFIISLRIAAILAIAADLVLVFAVSNKNYILGEILLGAAAGTYWPSVEYAVPICCQEGDSGRGFALARSADAFGVCIGALIGLIATNMNNIRIIYIVEILCMLLLLLVLKSKILNSINATIVNPKKLSFSNYYVFGGSKELPKLIKKLLPILCISLLGTAILSLMQIGLQLDLVKGGINRYPTTVNTIGLIIAYKLILLLIIQWPIGNYMAKKPIKFALKSTLISFIIGSLTLAISSYFKDGISIFLFGLIPITVGIAIFLPTATKAIIEESPVSQRGLSMSLYSQCYGISFLVVPFISGKIIDLQGNGILMWYLVSIFCLIIFPLTNKLGGTSDPQSVSRTIG